jgi:hypothetical protein
MWIAGRGGCGNATFQYGIEGAKTRLFADARMW